MFVSRLKQATDCKTVLDFASKHAQQIHSVAKFKNRHENQQYPSFVVTLPDSEVGKLLQGEIWPKDVLLKRFYRDVIQDRIAQSIKDCASVS